MNRISDLGQTHPTHYRGNRKENADSDQNAAKEGRDSPPVSFGFSEEARRLSRIGQSSTPADETPSMVKSKDAEFKPSRLIELLKLGNNGSGNHEDRLKGLSEKYSELRDDIQNTYSGDEDEMNKQLGGLDNLFQTLLSGSNQLSMRAVSVDVLDWVLGEAEPNKTDGLEQAKVQTEANANSVIKNLNDNMNRHMSAFYESFTAAIKDKDFDTAFAESMALLKSSETSSYEEISYDDLTKIMDVTRNHVVEREEDGNLKYRYPSTEDALKALLEDSEIPEVVRNGIIQKLGPSDDEK